MSISSCWILHVYGDTIVPGTLLNYCLSSTCRSPRCWLKVFHRLTSWSLPLFLKGGTKKSTKSVCFQWLGQSNLWVSSHLSVHCCAGSDSKPCERKRSTYPPYVACGGRDALSSILFKWCSCKERIQNIAQIPDLINSNSWNDLINLWGFGGMIL